MEYGINVTNKFAFLGDDEDVTDPAEVLAKTQQAVEKEKLAPKPVAKKPVAPPTKPVSANTNNKENIDGRRTQPRGEFRRGPPPGGKGPRGPRRGDDENNAPNDTMNQRVGENRPPRQHRGPPRDDANRGPGRNAASGQWNRVPRAPRPDNVANDENAVGDGEYGRVNGGGGGGNRQYDNRGPRGPRHDRNSRSDKTGVRPVPKKDGHGRGNWGTERDELAGETTDADAALNKSAENTEQVVVEGGENNENVGGEKDGVEEEAEKVNQMTLEEWKAQQKAQEPKFNLRKAGEGGDQKVYKNLVLAKPAKQEVSEEDETEDVNQNRREKREKPLNIEVSFSGSNRNRGFDRREGGDRRGGDYRGGDRRGGYDNDRPRGGGNRGPGGPPRRGPNDGAGPSGSGRRGPANSGGGGFNLAAEQFPALGAR